MAVALRCTIGQEYVYTLQEVWCQRTKSLSDHIWFPKSLRVLPTSSLGRYFNQVNISYVAVTNNAEIFLEYKKKPLFLDSIKGFHP